jgi:hypothetical protein
VDEIKRAFSSVFTRDVRAVEPGKVGLIVGDNVRIYKEGNGYRVAFLTGTDLGTRKQITSKLDDNGISYQVGDDFTT